jgi:hypothetical protein
MLAISRLLLMIFTAALFCHTTVLQAQDVVEEREFIFEGNEKYDYYRYCELLTGRGDACESLLKRLCPRIDHKRRDCALLRAKECQRAYRKEQTKEERECPKGAHAGFCYGNNKKCRYEETMACMMSNYSERYCDSYFWVYCRNVVGTRSNGEFKSQKCRTFHNEKMIEWWEDEVSAKLAWSAYGQNNIKAGLKILEKQKEALEKELESIEDSLSSIVNQLVTEVIGSVISELKDQKKRLEERRDELKNVLIPKVTARIKEHEHMGAVCEALAPSEN